MALRDDDLLLVNRVENGVQKSYKLPFSGLKESLPLNIDGGHPSFVYNNPPLDLIDGGSPT